MISFFFSSSSLFIQICKRTPAHADWSSGVTQLLLSPQWPTDLYLGGFVGVWAPLDLRAGALTKARAGPAAWAWTLVWAVALLFLVKPENLSNVSTSLLCKLELVTQVSQFSLWMISFGIMGFKCSFRGTLIAWAGEALASAFLVYIFIRFLSCFLGKRMVIRSLVSTPYKVLALGSGLQDATPRLP